MQLHLDDIAAKVAPAAHAILIFDQAGWHGAKSLRAPPDLSLTPLPPRSPELNPQQNIWQFMRANWLSNACSNPTTILSITAATPGIPSSITPGRSCPSPAANGQPSVSHCEDSY
jgi:hypothetical protein